MLCLLVGVHAAGNPLLCPIDDPVLPIFGLLGVGLETKYIRSGVGLGNGEANEFLAGKDIGEHAPLKLFGSEVHHGREPNYQTTHNT